MNLLVLKLQRVFFNAVDGYLKKSNFNNIDVFNMLLREDRMTIVRSISP